MESRLALKIEKQPFDCEKERLFTILAAIVRMDKKEIRKKWGSLSPYELEGLCIAEAEQKQKLLEKCIRYQAKLLNRMEELRQLNLFHPI